MKKNLLLILSLFLGMSVYTSCTKDDSVVTASKGTDPEAQSEGSVAQLLESITGTYGFDQVVFSDGVFSAKTNDAVGMTYKFFSDETDLSNNIIKISVYYPGIDSTFYLYSNPDATVNKVTYRSESGNHVGEYKLSNFNDLYLFNSKVVSGLEVSPADSPLKRALTLTIAYTFAPTLTHRPINSVYPKNAVKVSVKGGLYDAVLALASQCGSINCFKRDGYIHVNNVWLVWGSCTC